MLDFLKLRFRFVVLLVRIWLVKAELRLIFPDPVLLNRLAAPRWVFILGMAFVPVSCFVKFDFLDESAKFYSILSGLESLF